MIKQQNRVVIPPPASGRPPLYDEHINRMKPGEYKTFKKDIRKAISFARRARQLGRMPARRSVDGEIRVYLQR
jgi:hypothetical protein